MSTISLAQLEAARTLVRLRDQRALRLRQLRDQLSQVRARDKAWSDLVFKRSEFRRNPALFEGLAPFYQSVPARHRRWIEFSYRCFLRDMIDPLRSLEPGVPTPKPRTVDFAAMPLSGRCYLLGPYLNIQQNNRFAEVDLARSDPARRLVIVQTGGPVDVELWRSRTDAITAWLTGGTLTGTWVVSAHSASTVTLARQPSLPAVIPFDRSHLAPAALFAGIDVVSRKPLHIPFADLTAGTYIPGSSGTGKTSALHVLLRSIFANLQLFAAVYLIDGKDGVAMQRYARLHSKVHVLFDEPEVWKLAAELVEFMRARNAEQRALGIDKATKDLIAVVIDELPTFVAKPARDAKKEHEAFVDNLQKIAMRGRSAGLRMFLISQSPVADQIPVTLRTNCATTIAFRLPENVHATAVFGTLDSSNDPRKLPTGQAIVNQTDTGKITRVQFPFAPLYQPRRFA